MVGELPISKQRKRAYFFGILGAVTVILGTLLSLI
jgi:predicted tellurium resistance membrane protein TerC